MPARARAVLLLCALLFGLAGQAKEAVASSFSLFAGSAFSEVAAPAHQFLALGGSGSRDKEALSTRNVKQTSQTEEFLQGSFIGALLFGYPYTGMNTFDFIVLLMLTLFVARTLGARNRKRRDQQSDDRFSVDRNNQDLTGEPKEKIRTRVEDLRPADPGKTAPGKRDGAGNSRDNAWSRRLGGKNDPQGRPSSQDPQDQPSRRRPQTVQDNAAAMWGRFKSQTSQTPRNEALAGNVALGAYVPAGFDVPEFLEGARALYVRLQQAWGARKVDDLAPFISAQLLDLLQKRAAADPHPVAVEILLVNATLNQITQEGQVQKAEVAFSVVMRTGQVEDPSEVHETWTFARGGDAGEMWRLTGVRQQL